MNNLMLRFSGVDLSRLRTLVAGVGKEIALATSADVPPQGPRPSTGLAVAWSDLLQMLDLGSEPEMRACPACGHQSMLGATLCMHCWASLPAVETKEKGKA